MLIAYNRSRAKYFAQATTQRFRICHAPIERRFPFACEGTSMRHHVHSTGAHGAAASRALADQMSDAMAKELMPLQRRSEEAQASCRVATSRKGQGSSTIFARGGSSPTWPAQHRRLFRLEGARQLPKELRQTHARSARGNL